MSRVTQSLVQKCRAAIEEPDCELGKNGLPRGLWGLPWWAILKQGPDGWYLRDCSDPKIFMVSSKYKEIEVEL